MSRFNHRGRLLLASALFVLALGFAVARVGFLTEAGGVRLGASWVMTDFYSAAYYPVHAVLQGQTPYDRDSTFPPYAPTHLLMHLPFALLPPRAAAITYFLFTALLTLPLAFLALGLARVKPEPARVVALAAAILLSRPGHWTLLLGQVAILLTVLTYVALVHARTKPTLAGWAIMGALLKPTYGIPLVLLLWAWGHRKIAVLGVGLAALVNLPLLALLAAREGGVGGLMEAALGGYRGWQEIADVNPATSNTRTDAASLISRFVGAPLSSVEQVLLTASILLLAVAVLRLLGKQPTRQADALAVGIICITTSLIGFHRGYDLVLLTAPFLAAAVPGALPLGHRGIRWMLLALYSILALNWIATESVLQRWQPSGEAWLAVTSLNGLCLIVLYLGYLGLGVRYHARILSSPAPDDRITTGA
jgi:hypothetical protein